MSLRMSLFVLFLLARSFVHFSFACPKEKPNQRERTPPDIHIPIRPPSRRVCGTRFAQTVLDLFRLSWRPSLTGCSLNGGRRPPPVPSAREGSSHPLIMSSRQSDSDEGSCYCLQMKEILPPYGRQNDRVVEERFLT